MRQSADADIDPEGDASAAPEAAISDEEATVLSNSIIDAKQDLVREEVDADSATGSGAIFEEFGIQHARTESKAVESQDE